MCTKFFLWTLLALVFLQMILSSPNLNYGSFSFITGKLGTCKGPKRRDCCNVKLFSNNGTDIVFDFSVKENFLVTTGKVVALSQGREMVKFQIKKPCDNFLIKSMFQIYLNVTDNCYVHKGHYVFKVNLQETSEKYFDGKYFYGNWTFRSVFTSKDCNFYCTLVEIITRPRRET